MSKDKRTPSSIPVELIDSLLQNCDPKELLSYETRRVYRPQRRR